MGTSRTLAVPRNGTGRLQLVNGKPRQDQQGQIIAAFQTSDAESVSQSVPKRVVVRCDGDMQRPGGTFPCGVLRVDYTIGGQAKSVLIDAVSQSALVVWACTVEVVPVYDERRIKRIAAYSMNPAPDQKLSAATNADAEVGDVGAGDARWLDALAKDFSTEGGDEISIHPIPDGARGVRFLNAVKGTDGTGINTAALAKLISFSPGDFGETALNEIVMGTWTAATPSAVIMIPACSRFLFVSFPTGTFATFKYPAWLEWIIAPSSIPSANV